MAGRATHEAEPSITNAFCHEGRNLIRGAVALPIQMKIAGTGPAIIKFT